MSLKIDVDWHHTNAGSLPDYVGTGVDVTGLVRVESSAVHVEYGRDQATALAPTVAGRGSFVLDNKDRRFSPRNPSSPLYGLVKPARPVRITREFTSAGPTPAEVLFPSASLFPDGETATYNLFHGHTDDSPINPDLESKSVSVSLMDRLADFRGFNISTSLYDGIRTGEAIHNILDAFGWTGARDIDNGATVMPYWWEEGTDALTALEKVLRCEGPPAYLTVGPDGEIIFRDRHHRLLNAESITSQGTWWDDGVVEPVMSVPFTYDDAWRNIINAAIVNIDVRTRHPWEVGWSVESPIGLSAFETKAFIVSTSDPFYGAIIPEEWVDYSLIAGSVSVSLSRHSGASTTITLVAGVNGAQLTGLQLRVEPVKVAYTVQVTASDLVSIDDYGPRSFPGDLPFCNPHDAQAVVDTAIEQRSQPLAIVHVRFMIGRNTARCDAILGLNLSNRITIVEPETVLDDDFFVEHIAHDFTMEADHAVTIGLEAVPPDGAVTPSNIFLVGGGAGHQIGDGVLAS